MNFIRFSGGRDSVEPLRMPDYGVRKSSQADVYMVFSGGEIYPAYAGRLSSRDITLAATARGDTRPPVQEVRACMKHRLFVVSCLLLQN